MPRRHRAGGRWRESFSGHSGRAKRGPESITTNRAITDRPVFMDSGLAPPARPGMTSPTMLAHAGDLDHARLRRKACALRGRIETVGDRRGRRLADRSAVLADQEYDRCVARVIVDAGEERVAALDAMHETVGGEKIER